MKNIHGVLKSNIAATSTSTPETGNGVNQAFIVEDTSSSISSFQSTSDQSSVAGSLVESPTKSEPLDAFSTMTASSSNDNMTETITMTLEDINQFAQDIY